MDVGVVSRMFWAPCSAKAQVSGLACSAETGCGSAPVLRGALFCQVWDGPCSVCPGCPGEPVLRKGPGGEPPAVTILWMAGRPAPLDRSRGGAAVVRSTLGSGGAGLPAAGDGKSAGHIPAGELLQEEAGDIGAALIRVGDG